MALMFLMWVKFMAQADYNKLMPKPILRNTFHKSKWTQFILNICSWKTKNTYVIKIVKPYFYILLIYLVL